MLVGKTSYKLLVGKAYEEQLTVGREYLGLSRPTIGRERLDTRPIVGR